MKVMSWKNECRRLILWLLLAAAVGWSFAITWQLMLVTSLVYIGWFFFQLNRIQNWLETSSNSTLPPEARGVWGAILDDIYSLQRRNIEKLERMEAAVNYLQDSFTSLVDGAIMIDINSNIEWSNRAAEKLLGLRYPEDNKQQLTNLIRSPEFINYFELGGYQQPLFISSPYNDMYQLQISITYFGQGSRLIFVRDITETNRLQQMRKDFVANVSHELRTPLTVINGYLETFSGVDLADVIHDELRWRRVVDQMLSQSQRMETLIHDLMTLSRLESVPESTTSEPVNVFTMLKAIRSEALATVKGERQIDIECDESLLLEGSYDELYSAFANLVLNAAKYTNQGGHIVVRCYSDHQHQYLEVEDDGDGIDEHHLPRLTERFYRVDNSRSIETGGTGLGLAIVKHILVRHQAELKIRSRRDEGSVFTCVFPKIRTLAPSSNA